MASPILCLDIAGDTVAGVLVDSGSKIAVVAACAQTDLQGRSFEDGVATVCRQAGFVDGECRLSLGTEFFSFRNIDLPFSERKKIEQVLPFELENLLAAEPGSFLVSYNLFRASQNGAQIVAATIGKEFLTDLLTEFKKAGIDPATVEIRGVRIALRIAAALAGDCVFLDFGSSTVGLILVSKGRVGLIRALQFNSISAAENSVAELITLIKQTLLFSRIIDLEKGEFTIASIGGGPDMQDTVRQLEAEFSVDVKQYRLTEQPNIKIDPTTANRYQPRLMDAVLTLGLDSGAGKGVFNFRKDEFKKKRSSPERRAFFLKAALPVFIFIVGIVIYFGYDFRKLHGQNNLLKERIVQVFSETLPEVRRIVNPVKQLQVKSNEIKKTYSDGKEGAGYTVLALLTELSARIPASYPVRVKRLVADSEGIRIKGVTSDFNTVDNMQKELEKSPYFQTVTISSANQSVRGDEVRFELKLELRLGVL